MTRTTVSAAPDRTEALLCFLGQREVQARLLWLFSLGMASNSAPPKLTPDCQHYLASVILDHSPDNPFGSRLLEAVQAWQKTHPAAEPSSFTPRDCLAQLVQEFSLANPYSESWRPQATSFTYQA